MKIYHLIRQILGVGVAAVKIPVLLGCDVMHFGRCELTVYRNAFTTIIVVE